MNDFQKKVLDITKQMPCEKITTYKIIGQKMNTKAYRAIWQALTRNPYAPTIPCHRVVSSNWGIGGYAFWVEKKIQILKEEWISVLDGEIIDFEKRLWK